MGQATLATIALGTTVTLTSKHQHVSVVYIDSYDYVSGELLTELSPGGDGTELLAPGRYNRATKVYTYHNGAPCGVLPWCTSV